MSTFSEDAPGAPSNPPVVPLKPTDVLPSGPDSAAQADLLSPKGKEQARLLGLLDTNQAKLARLFASLPTFDSVLKRLLVNTLQTKIPSRKLRTSRPDEIDPDFCYVGHFTADSNGGRSLTTSQSFTDVLWRCMQTDTPETYMGSGVGFFTRPDSAKEADSLFVDPLDAQDLRAMEAVLYLANPATNERVKRQFRDDLAQFRSRPYREDNLELPTTAAAFAHWLSLRFLHLFNLYKVDRRPAAQLTPSERIQQKDEDRLLDIITTHPAKADRNRLLLAPIPHVYTVMLAMGTAAPQKWPAAMVIKFTDRLTLFLYSLEGGLQRFRSVQDLISNVHPTHDGQERTILDITTELSGHVFEVAADDLLQLQSTALETALNAPGNETLALNTFAQRVESALGLSMLSLAEPLAVRQQTLVENNRPGFYKAATRSEQAHYRRLEGQVFKAVYALGGGVPTLLQFTRQQIRQYLERTVYPGIEPDPDKTTIMLFQGGSARPSQFRSSSLTQLMLDNLRPHQYPNAMREVLPVYLLDRHGQRVRHPANGFFVTLTGTQLARMANHLDVGGRYETLLRREMNKPQYKAAWQAAYLANLQFKGYEAALRGDEVFKASLLDKAFNPPRSRKRVALWLDAVLGSPTAAGRAWVDGRKVCVHGLVLGGSVGAGGQQDALNNAVSIDGVLIFSDHDGPDIQGTVGVYFPDSPGGDDFREFADLSDGIAGLLPEEQWQAYFRSRISTLDPGQIKRLLGQQGGRPLIRGVLLSGDLFEVLHKAYVEFQSAYADHRSNSNRDISHQTAAKLAMMTVEIIFDLAGLLLVPGFQMLKRAIKTGLLVLKTGAVPTNLPTLAFVDRVANHVQKGLAGGVSVPVRGKSTFLAMTGRPNPAEALAGLPLEEALYRRYAVTDTSLLQGVTPDPQSFYRPTLTQNATGSVTRPVYVRQPDGTVFRVHDHTRLRATEATIVDPITGLSIRSSGVMRSTVARMPDGEWRAVGHGSGGGKRSPSPQPGPSNPKRPAALPRSASNLVRTPNEWDVEIMDLVPALVTQLPNWPRNRSLLIIEQRPERQDWSVRFTPGQVERAYPAIDHPLRSDTDIVLSRIGENHYNLLLGEEVVAFDADGDCFFNAVARGLNEGQAQQRFSMQGLRNDVADYIDLHPQVNDYLVVQPSGIQQMLSDNAPTLADIMGEQAVLDLTQVIYGGVNPHRLFQPIRDYLNLHVRAMERRVLNQAQVADLPPEILQHIGHLLSPRMPGRLLLSSIPYYTQKSQALQAFFEDVLLQPIASREIAELLNNEYLMLSQDVVHVMLEYGVRARDLTDHHPRNEMAYVKYDEAVHGQLTDDQLDQQLDGALLVDRDDLEKVARRFERETGTRIDDDIYLMDQFVYYDRVDDLTDLLIVSLERYPVLLARARILLRSPVIASNLGGLFPVKQLAAWIRDPALNDARLQIIAEYASSHYQEIVRTGRIDIDWMRPFDDRNLHNLVRQQDELVSFWDFLPGFQYLEDSNMSTAVGLFSISGQMASNNRIAIFFETPNLWRAIQTMPGISPRGARRIWEDLVGPQFSDENIRRTLAQRGSLSSESAFTSALIDSLTLDEAHAHRIILGAYGVTPRQVLRFMNNFEFTGALADHSRLALARYLARHGSIPDWAWQYARAGVTPESLRSFLAARKTS
ncbi:dermonecrotic toxin domain-containing protein [Pseudomonas sp. R3-41]